MIHVIFPFWLEFFNGAVYLEEKEVRDIIIALSAMMVMI